MKIDEVIRRLQEEAHGESDILPVVLVVGSHEIGPAVDGIRRGEVVDVQPCLWNERTGDACSPEDEDLGPGYVRAVALLTKGAS